MDLSRLAINQVTTPQWSLAEAIEGYRKQGVTGIGVWRDRLAQTGLAQAKARLADAGMWVPSLCKTGDVSGLAHQPGAAVDDCRRAIDEAKEIGAPCVVFVCGGQGPAHSNIADARKRVAEVLQTVAIHARACGVSIGLEPFHPMHAAERGCVSSLRQALELRTAIGPEISIILDVFHCWWDPELMPFIGANGRSAIASVHLCDWRVPTRHPVMDRAMPGDGAGNVAGMVCALEGSGYAGPYEIEIFSDEWAARDPDEIVRTCVERYHALG